MRDFLDRIGDWMWGVYNWVMDWIDRDDVDPRRRRP